MTVVRFEVALVCRDSSMLDFFAEVFEMTPEAPLETEIGVMHRFSGGEYVLKLILPPDQPSLAARPGSRYSTTGVSHFTFFVNDVDAAIERAVARGATVVRGPWELRPGVRFAVMEDPEGNTIELGQS